jgi:ribosomal-protein-alanine N-acetyltransferase
MLNINFTPFPNLETEHLYLRRVVEEDVNEIFALRSNTETMKYIPRPLVKTKEDARAHIAMIDKKSKIMKELTGQLLLKTKQN